MMRGRSHWGERKIFQVEGTRNSWQQLECSGWSIVSAVQRSRRIKRGTEAAYCLWVMMKFHFIQLQWEMPDSYKQSPVPNLTLRLHNLTCPTTLSSTNCFFSLYKAKRVYPSPLKHVTTLCLVSFPESLTVGTGLGWGWASQVALIDEPPPCRRHERWVQSLDSGKIPGRQHGNPL